MADQQPIPAGNGSGETGDQPQISILAQYIKDLSVENPSAPQVFQWQEQATLDVQYNLQVDQVGEDVHEVIMRIEVSARSAQGVHFVVDLSYAGLFGIRNVPTESLGPVLLIEAPRMTFPFARQIVAEATANAGFPPLLLDPIDFAAAYFSQLQAAEGGADATGGAISAPPASDAPDQA